MSFYPIVSMGEWLLDFPAQLCLAELTSLYACVSLNRGAMQIWVLRFVSVHKDKSDNSIV